VKYKASFLGVPCLYDPETGDLDARYGKINDLILSVMIEIWWFLGTVDDHCSGHFPIKLYRK
jgi:hypothetical protein